MYNRVGQFAGWTAFALTLSTAAYKAYEALPLERYEKICTALFISNYGQEFVDSEAGKNLLPWCQFTETSRDVIPYIIAAGIFAFMCSQAYTSLASRVTVIPNGEA